MAKFFPPIPAESVEWLFTQLELRYGTRFTSMWNKTDPAQLKAFWGVELACLNGRSDAIKYGLDHLPDAFPPTAAEFKKICLGKPRNERLLERPRANPAIIQAALSAIKPIRTTRPSKQWAVELRHREDAGEILTPFQRRSWRAVLQRHQPPTEQQAA